MRNRIGLAEYANYLERTIKFHVAKVEFSNPPFVVMAYILDVRPKVTTVVTAIRGQIL